MRPTPSYSKRRNSISSDASSVGNPKSVLSTAKRMEQDEIKSVKIRFKNAPLRANILPASRHIGGFGGFQRRENEATLANSTTPRFLGTLNLDYPDSASSLHNYRVIDPAGKKRSSPSPHARSPTSSDQQNARSPEPLVLAASSVAEVTSRRMVMGSAGLPVIEERARGKQL